MKNKNYIDAFVTFILDTKFILIVLIIALLLKLLQW
mgnify:CR=1 FL=1